MLTFSQPDTDTVQWSYTGDPLGAEGRLELWQKSHSGDARLATTALTTLTYALVGDQVYRLYVKAVGDVEETSERVDLLRTSGLRASLRALLVKSLTSPRAVAPYCMLRRLLLKAEGEFSKSNFLGATEYLEKFSTYYNTLK